MVIIVDDAGETAKQILWLVSCILFKESAP